jgi:hypothetical protein
VKSGVRGTPTVDPNFRGRTEPGGVAVGVREPLSTATPSTSPDSVTHARDLVLQGQIVSRPAAMRDGSTSWRDCDQYVSPR